MTLKMYILVPVQYQLWRATLAYEGKWGRDLKDQE